MIDLLVEWGKWSRHDWGYYSSPMYQLMKKNNPKFALGWSGDIPNITDDDAMRISAVVAELARTNLVLANVLKYRYIQDMSLRDISRYYMTPLEYPEQADMDWHDKRKKRVGTATISRLLEEAERYVRRRI